jgi:hypothetical protein
MVTVSALYSGHRQNATSFRIKEKPYYHPLQVADGAVYMTVYSINTQTGDLSLTSSLIFKNVKIKVNKMDRSCTRKIIKLHKSGKAEGK